MRSQEVPLCVNILSGVSPNMSCDNLNVVCSGKIIWISMRNVRVHMET